MIKYIGQNILAMVLMADYVDQKISFKTTKGVICTGKAQTRKLIFSTWILNDRYNRNIAEFRKGKSSRLSGQHEYIISYLGKEYQLNYASVNGRYEMQLDNDLYEVFIHNHEKVSFFKNQRQFAYMVNPMVSICFSEKVSVFADEDASLGLLCMLIYVVKVTNDDDFPMQSMPVRSRKFDDMWKPA